MLGSSAHTLIGLAGAGDARTTTAAEMATADPPTIAKHARTRLFPITQKLPIAVPELDQHRCLPADPQGALRLLKLCSGAVDLVERIADYRGGGHVLARAGQRIVGVVAERFT